MKVLAAIDCGSNSFHLLVVRVDETRGTWETVAKDKEMVRLAADLQDGMLSEAAQERGIQALKRFRQMAKSLGAERLLATATSAVREAHNGAEFIARAEREAGVTVEVISGNEEARLIYLGVTSALHYGGRKAAIIDIGGGSTELVIGSAAEPLFTRSLKIGAVRLHEQYLQGETIDPEAYYRLVAHVKGTLHQIVPSMREIGYDFAIATSGTALTLAEIDAHASGLPAQKSMNGYVLTRERLHALEHRLGESLNGSQRGP